MKQDVMRDFTYDRGIVKNLLKDRGLVIKSHISKKSLDLSFSRIFFDNQPT